jgi:hypothetical protein
MEVEIHSRTETGITYPAKPSGLSTEADALDADALWARIEAWIAHRFSERTVTWIVRNRGEFVPDLTPAGPLTVERWQYLSDLSIGFEAYTPDPTPAGGVLLVEGPRPVSDGYPHHRITATVGANNAAPPVVQDAFRRLAEYLAVTADAPAGSSRYGVTMGTGLSEQVTRDPRWIARALELSGAADLLRPFRRA